MRLDHVSYAVTHHELSDTVQSLGQQLGATFVDGGRHPSAGTTNFVLPLVGGTYVEVVAALDHPAADKAPFGRAVRARADAGGGWLGWVIETPDITLVERRLGRDAVDGKRVRPDGTALTWKQIGVTDMMRDASLPFFIQWTCDPSLHPAAGSTSPVAVVGVEIAGDAAVIRDWVGGDFERPVEGQDVTWVDSEENGLLAVHFRTANGDVVRVD